ncbi:MAG: HAD hydrolase-like protein [Methanotrichaceae archaeon]
MLQRRSRKCTLKRYFVAVISTTPEFRVVKDFPEAIIELCRYLNVRPEEVMQIGDHRYLDYEVPKEAGLRAFYLDREMKFKDDRKI